MRNSVLKISIAFIILIHTSSCKKGIDEFLETPPGVSLNEDAVFSSREQIEQYISTGYQFSIPTFLPQRDAIGTAIASSPTGGAPNAQQTIFAGATDEAESSADFVANQNWNIGAINPIIILNQEDYMYFARFKGIRIANILLERIDAAPVDESYKNQVKAEAKFLRAINNFETFKRYGGYQIIDKRLTVEEANTIARSTIKESIDFIVKDCDEAFAELPAGFPDAVQKGRVNKSAILALKARTLLYAASPLFNTGTPYLSFTNNELICYGNFDNERWKLAAAAARDAITQAGAEGFLLLDNPAKRDPAPVSGAVLGNYRESWELPDNNELILSYKGYPASGRFGFPWQHVIPGPNVPSFDGFWSGTSVNHRFIKRYEKKIDGTPQNWQSSGNDLVQKYNQLDPRFSQTVGFNGSRFSNNTPILETFTGGVHAVNCKTGAWMKKLVPDNLYTGNQVPTISVYRFNELLLNLAEALNEHEGAPSTEAYDAINRIRLRSGMPPLPAGLSKEQFRERVRNERAIELAFENYRFWDIRRWLIAEDDGIMRGNVLGLRITRLPAAGQFAYEEFVLEPRVFNRQQYLHPFQRDEVIKNPNLVQNPGW